MSAVLKLPENILNTSAKIINKTLATSEKVVDNAGYATENVAIGIKNVTSSAESATKIPADVLSTVSSATTAISSVADRQAKLTEIKTETTVQAEKDAQDVVIDEKVKKKKIEAEKDRSIVEKDAIKKIEEAKKVISNEKTKTDEFIKKKELITTKNSNNYDVELEKLNLSKKKQLQLIAADNSLQDAKTAIENKNNDALMKQISIEAKKRDKCIDIGYQTDNWFSVMMGISKPRYSKLGGLIPKKGYYVVTKIINKNDDIPVEISVKEFEEATNTITYKYVNNNGIEQVFDDTQIIDVEKVIFNHVDMKPSWRGGKTRKRERRRKSKRTRKNRRSRRRRRS